VEAWKVRFSGDGSQIYTGGNSGKFYQYDTDSGDLSHDSRHGEAFVSTIAVSGMGDLAIANSTGDLYFQSIEGESSTFLTEHKKYIRSLQFTADGSKILIASDDLRISVFDM
jgi:WD40 repeat protein